MYQFAVNTEMYAWRWAGGKQRGTHFPQCFDISLSILIPSLLLAWCISTRQYMGCVRDPASLRQTGDFKSHLPILCPNLLEYDVKKGLFRWLIYQWNNSAILMQKYL